MNVAGVSIKGSWLVWGAVAGVAALWLLSQRDRNGDGRPDGLFYGLSRDVGGAVTGTGRDIYVGTFDGAASGIGLPVVDAQKCMAAKDAGDIWGQIKNCSTFGDSADVKSDIWNTIFK